MNEDPATQLPDVAGMSNADAAEAYAEAGILGFQSGPDAGQSLP